MAVQGMFAELSRRRVFRVAATYAVVAWLAVQIAASLAPALRLPEWAVGFVVYLLVLCFPVAMVLAWAYDIGPSGIVSDTSVQRVPMRQLLTLSFLALITTLGLFLLLSVTVGGVPVQADGMVWRTGELQDRSIAFTQFADNSPGQDQGWLATSLGQEVLNRLPEIDQLSIAEVPAGIDPREIGRTHAVASVLSGNIQRVGVRVRVTVRLTDTASGYHVWSATYDGELDDVFDFQVRTASAVTEDLKRLFDGVTGAVIDPRGP